MKSSCCANSNSESDSRLLAFNSPAPCQPQVNSLIPLQQSPQTDSLRSQQSLQPRIDFPSNPLPIDITISTQSVDSHGPLNSKPLNTDETGHNTTSSLDSLHRKSCVVVGCKETIAPSMWRHHMTGHLRGVYQGEVPTTWLKEHNMCICSHCSSFVSRWASHQLKCYALSLGHEVSSTSDLLAQPNAVIPPELGNNLHLLPPLDDICSLKSPTIRFIPKRARLGFAKVLSSVLKEIISDNSVTSWLKLMMLPKCVLPSCQCRGRHNKPVPIEFLCDLWMQNQFNELWNMALSRVSSTTNHHRTKTISPKQQILSAISLAQDGLYSKACQTLVSSGLAPNNAETWRLLEAKHPKGKAPIEITAYLAGGNLTALNKYKPGCPFDVWPIAVGEALCRLVGKCLCAAVKVRAQQFFHPFQFGVACPLGAEQMIHGLRDCIEQHWIENDFVVLKVDLKNAFNMVSRQAVLNECAPILWHPLGVQQGDPLGPLLFSLVLNILVSEISSRGDCSLNYHAWYLDDGALAGPGSSVYNILAMLQELGPSLGLHVNIRKCEVFSHSSLDLFPAAIKKSHTPNLDILGSPLGDAEFCHHYIAQKRLEAQSLLSRLDDVGLIDPQVTLTLLHMCGGFCRLVHLARTTPPLLSHAALQLYDQDVRRCFSSCIAVDTSDVAWKQSILGLSKGGLGLRSLHHHAPAAYIASVCSSGFGSKTNDHLCSAVAYFNPNVPPDMALQIDAILSAPSVQQHKLSSMLDTHMFNLMLENSFIADRARLLSVSSAHASSWLSVVPSQGLGLHLDPPVHQIAIKWWLGLDTSLGSQCALCPGIALDPLGHHAITCKRGGDVVTRHNTLRDALAEISTLVLLTNWATGKTAAFDISVTSPLNTLILLEAGVAAGSAAQATETRKHMANDAKCNELGWLCVPLVAETYGAWGKEAMEAFSQLASRLATHTCRLKSAVTFELYSRLNLHLVRANATAILTRCI
ncbi:hypothetical protein EMCRGX_G000834 [Ephydatia muelleri]